MRLFLFVLVFLVGASELAMSQSFYAMRRKLDETLIVSVGLNTSTYYGDLKPKTDYLDFKPSLSFGATYYFTDRIAARAEISWITFSGDDALSGEKDKEWRNLSFKSSNAEFNAVGIVNLLPHGAYFYQRPKINVYGIVGIGVLRFNPKADYKGKTYELQPLKTEGVNYSRVTAVIPYGFGIKYFLKPNININLEFGWRKTFTDYLDDVSTKYIDNSSFSDPVAAALADRGSEVGQPIRPAGSKRGTASNKDAYMLFSIKGEYYLPSLIGDRKLYNQKRKSYYRRR